MWLVRILLFPFAVMYACMMHLRNKAFDVGILKSTRFETPTLVIGNLSMGGTGKTPMMEYLIRLLDSKSLVSLSRGYGRKTKGFRWVGERDDAQSVGDEPFQLFQKFRNKISVTVGEDRVAAIRTIIQEKPQTELILLDDAFQHRYLKADLYILLTEFSRPFFKDFVVPSGRLRESRSGAQRADLICVSKCPTSISEEQMKAFVQEIKPYCRTSTPIFFTSIQYQAPLAIFGNQQTDFQSIIILSGIANADSMVTYLKQAYRVLDHLEYPDHHQYTTADIHKIQSTWERYSAQKVAIMTTEKDKTRLETLQLTEVQKSLPWFYLPIAIEFVKDGALFDKIMLEISAKA